MYARLLLADQCTRACYWLTRVRAPAIDWPICTRVYYWLTSVRAPAIGWRMYARLLFGWRMYARLLLADQCTRACFWLTNVRADAIGWPMYARLLLADQYVRASAIGYKPKIIKRLETVVTWSAWSWDRYFRRCIWFETHGKRPSNHCTEGERAAWAVVLVEGGGRGEGGGGVAWGTFDLSPGQVARRAENVIPGFFNKSEEVFLIPFDRPWCYPRRIDL